MENEYKFPPLALSSFNTPQITTLNPGGLSASYFSMHLETGTHISFLKYK